MMDEIKLEEYIEFDEEEAREFLSKYNCEELDQFDFIFYFAMSHNLKTINKVLSEIKKEKGYDYKNPDSDITDKNSVLSFRELNYLYNLTDDGWMCTVNTREFFDYSEEGEELSRIRDSVYKEMEKRQTQKNNNTLSLKPTL